MKQATFSGWEWLVEVSNHVGAGLLVLAAVGISAVSAVKLPHWWWGVIILAGFYALLFAEGAFRVYEASAGGNSGPPDVAVESRNVAAEVRTVRLIAAEIGADRETVLAAIGVSQVYKTVTSRTGTHTTIPSQRRQEPATRTGWRARPMTRLVVTTMP